MPKRRNPATPLATGKVFTKDGHDYTVMRLNVGFDTHHALLRRDDTGELYRVAKTPDGKRPEGEPTPFKRGR